MDTVRRAAALEEGNVRSRASRQSNLANTLCGAFTNGGGDRLLLNQANDILEALVLEDLPIDDDTDHESTDEASSALRALV